MSKTLAQCRAYIRSKIGELDSQRLFPGLLDADINFAQQKVQQDLIPLGIKEFNKITYNDNNYFAAPSDMLATPNAIEDIVAGSGARASFTVNYTSPTANITYTAREGGTGGNSIALQLDGMGASSPTVSVTFFGGNPTIIADFNSGADTCQEIIDEVNAHPIASYYVVASTTTPSAMPVPDVGTGINLANGTGDGFKPCREMTVKERGRISDNTYLAPSVTNPNYLRHGSIQGSQYIEILPSTITHSRMYYYYRLADLSADTDTLGIPEEYEELVLLYALTRAYETLGKMAETEAKKLDYEKKRQEYEQSYQNALASKQIDDRRLQSNDQAQ